MTEEELRKSMADFDREVSEAAEFLVDVMDELGELTPSEAIVYATAMRMVADAVMAAVRDDTGVGDAQLEDTMAMIERVQRRAMN